MAAEDLSVQADCVRIMTQSDRARAIVQRWVASRPMFLDVSEELGAEDRLLRPRMEEGETDVAAAQIRALNSMYRELHAEVKEEVAVAKHVFDQPAMVSVVGGWVEVDQWVLPRGGWGVVAAAATGKGGEGDRSHLAYPPTPCNPPVPPPVLPLPPAPPPPPPCTHSYTLLPCKPRLHPCSLPPSPTPHPQALELLVQRVIEQKVQSALERLLSPSNTLLLGFLEGAHTSAAAAAAAAGLEAAAGDVSVSGGGGGGGEGLQQLRAVSASAASLAAMAAAAATGTLALTADQQRWGWLGEAGWGVGRGEGCGEGGGVQ